jgi:beta-lactamase class A
MYDYDFNTYSVKRKKSKKRFFFLCFFICIIVLFVFFFPGKKTQEKSTLGEKTGSQSKPLTQQADFRNTPLEHAVSQALLDTQGSYAVVIINKKTGEVYMRNEHKEYQAASLYKLWVMVVVFQQIEQGKLLENASLKADIPVLNKKFLIGSESAELTEGMLDFTIASALRQMITISHNYAALALTEKIRLSTVATFLSENGFHESHVSRGDQPPITTASDTALFFTKLMNGELANEENTAKMIDLLKAQRLNNKLPRYLPKETVMAHKTGELGLFSHDAGIVYLPDGNHYVIAVFSETLYPSAAEERISQISQNVYEYFNK